jgi:cyclic-di-GMP-binding protein
MPSFDVVSKIDVQTFDNVINIVKKEIVTRFDFRDSKSNLELNKKDLILNISTEDEMRLNSIIDMVRSRMIKQSLSPLALDLSKEHYGSGSLIKKDIRLKQGLDKDTARKIVKLVKDLKLKVEAQVMDDQVRVSGKKIDELQSAIAHLRTAEVDAPLQFVNMK